ncbi:MAG: hypothetical protein KDD25_06455 [Bdellovibrionales bacterium]|nr:hypothetical protein [Bdellovibrionales bacterium]
MQTIRALIFVLSFFISIQSVAKVSSPGVESKTKGVNIVTGVYKLKSGDSKCFEGELRFTHVNGFESLVLNESILIQGLNKTSFSTKERACSTDVKNAVSKGKIESVEIRECKSAKLKVIKSVGYSNKSIHFTQITEAPSQEPVKFECLLTRVQ